MAFDQREKDLQRAHFRSKLAAEKQKLDVVRKVKEGRGEFVLLDARDHAAFEQGHVPGAHSLPLDQVPALAGELDANREYVVYCWNAT